MMLEAAALELGGMVLSLDLRLSEGVISTLASFFLLF